MFCFDRLLYDVTCLYNRGVDMDDGIEIEQASLEDAEMILQLQMRAYLSEAEIYNDYGIPPLTQSFKEIKQEFSQQVFLKAIQKGKDAEDDIDIIGAVRGYLEKGTAFIGQLIVEPESQNKGIGTRLMHAIEQRHEFADRYELFTGHKSARNLHLYQKLGYHEFKRVPVNDWLTMVFLEKYNNNNNQQQRK
jgi:ribosomal protein S18 acetylase RimI-like enzyme